MLKKLIVFAITSGLAAKLYKTYAHKKEAGGPTASNSKRTPAPRSRQSSGPTAPHANE